MLLAARQGLLLLTIWSGAARFLHDRIAISFSPLQLTGHLGRLLGTSKCPLLASLSQPWPWW